MIMVLEEKGVARMNALTVRGIIPVHNAAGRLPLTRSGSMSTTFLVDDVYQARINLCAGDMGYNPEMIKRGIGMI